MLYSSVILKSGHKDFTFILSLLVCKFKKVVKYETWTGWVSSSVSHVSAGKALVLVFHRSQWGCVHCLSVRTQPEPVSLCCGRRGVSQYNPDTDRPQRCGHRSLKYKDKTTFFWEKQEFDTEVIWHDGRSFCQCFQKKLHHHKTTTRPVIIWLRNVIICCLQSWV